MEGSSALRRPVDGWNNIGTVVGNTSTDKYTFILRSFQGRVGDIVATRVEVPAGPGAGRRTVTVWGRIVSIDRFNPFFPAEAAQELADERVRFLDTVLSGSRDHLEAEVLVLGATGEEGLDSELSSLTYPVKPSGEVLYPPAEAVRELLLGGDTDPARLRIGTLIARNDVEVWLSARAIISRHLAILAMTGGGKTVAARRIIKELIRLNYPLVIFDPHGDYLGLFEKRHLFPDVKIKIFYPMIRVRRDNIGIVADLIDKMGRRLTEAQQQFYHFLVSTTEGIDGEPATDYIQRLVDRAANTADKKRHRDQCPDEIANINASTINATKRSLEFVLSNLRQMELNNERLRSRDQFAGYEFHEMPDPADAPEDIVSPANVSIFYLAGYDHLNQSAIVSIVLEALFEKRSTLSGMIPPFQAIVEEAHNFIPSRQEGAGETPSLPTIRKVITEGRKFGTGLVLISQRPSRLDETTLAQCNSFLVLRLVNPRDKSFVRSVMENLSESDADILQTFARGRGIVSGQAVRFPLLVKIDFDADLVSDVIGDEDFLAEAEGWKPNGQRQSNARTMERHREAVPAAPEPAAAAAGDKPDEARKSRRRSGRSMPTNRRSRIKPEGF